MYYFGDPSKFITIDSKILIYESNDKAIEALNKKYNGADTTAVSDLGDKAYKFQSNTISFAKGDVQVTLISLNKEVDLHKFAIAYEKWLYQPGGI